MHVLLVYIRETFFKNHFFESGLSGGVKMKYQIAKFVACMAVLVPTTRRLVGLVKLVMLACWLLYISFCLFLNDLCVLSHTLVHTRETQL